MHNRRQSHPHERPGSWAPECRWLRREFFKYCANLEQREEWERRPKEPGPELPRLMNRKRIDQYYFRVMSNVIKWTSNIPQVAQAY